MTVRVEHGDMREVLGRMVAEGVRVQSIVCDPPYHLGPQKTQELGHPSWNGNTKEARAAAKTGFMGKQWDGGDIAFQAATWRLCYELLPPGGHLLAFSGTRTYHRMVCAIEEAGFEIRDTIAWLYGSGFPKSHSVEKALDPRTPEEIEAGIAQCAESLEWRGWGSALKPALEPICLARKPLDGTIAQTVVKHGTGALNIDGCRVGMSAADAEVIEKMGGFGVSGYVRPRTEGTFMSGTPDATAAKAHTAGRWPANIVTDGSDEVVSAFPERDGATSNSATNSTQSVALGKYGPREKAWGRADSGSAARFFYSAKADAGDRLGSKHPTVKPVDLMRWLVRLITPPKGTCLDPFAGSGTTGMACMAEGFDCILVERELEYVADIRRRIAHVHGQDTPLFADEPSLI